MTTGLLVAPCSHEAAKYAVMHWHYSRCMPKSTLIKYGVWEDGQFIGCVIFGMGATITYAKSMGVGQFEVCELVRVALREHKAPVTEIVAKSIKILRANNPDMRVILSFADPNHGHHGGIYIAGNWIYLGVTKGAHMFVINGEEVHPRTVSGFVRQFGGLRPGETRVTFLQRTMDPQASVIVPIPKHRYAYPLDRGMRRNLERKALPHPEPCGRGVNGDTPGFRSGGAGSIPVVRSVEGGRHVG